MSAKLKQEQTQPLPAAGNQSKAQPRSYPDGAIPFSTPIEDVVAAEVKKQLKALNGSTPKFSNDDARFLIWVLGFTAGANLERDSQRGERIFAWCRDLHEKVMAHTEGTNPS